MRDLRRVAVPRLGLVTGVAIAPLFLGVFATWLADDPVTLSKEG